MHIALCTPLARYVHTVHSGAQVKKMLSMFLEPVHNN